jgi:hypothetical protein
VQIEIHDRRKDTSWPTIELMDLTTLETQRPKDRIRDVDMSRETFPCSARLSANLGYAHTIAPGNRPQDAASFTV